MWVDKRLFRRLALMGIIACVAVASPGRPVKATSLNCGLTTIYHGNYSFTFDVSWSTIHWAVPVDVTVEFGGPNGNRGGSYWDHQGSDSYSYTYPNPGTYFWSVHIEDGLGGTCDYWDVWTLS